MDFMSVLVPSAYNRPQLSNGIQLNVSTLAKVFVRAFDLKMFLGKRDAKNCAWRNLPNEGAHDEKGASEYPYKKRHPQPPEPRFITGKEPTKGQKPDGREKHSPKRPLDIAPGIHLMSEDVHCIYFFPVNPSSRAIALAPAGPLKVAGGKVRPTGEPHPPVNVRRLLAPRRGA